MSRAYATFRIFLLFFTVGVAIGIPVVSKIQSMEPPVVTIEVPPLASSEPGVGTTFHIAGQDVVEPEEGQIVLKAPDICEVGELVRLDARDSDVDGLTWQILPYTDDFEVIETGQRAFFSSRAPGQYLIIVAGAKRGKPLLTHHTIIVEGEAGPPGPMTLPQKVAQWVRKVPDYEKRFIHAAAVAGVFKELAVKEDVQVDDMLEATAVANSAILGEDLEKWIPFLDALGLELDAFIEAGALDTREEYRETWLLIAKGIENTIPKETLEALQAVEE